MESKNWTRRDLLKVIGVTDGGAVLYQAMTSLRFANESHFKGAPHLTNAPKGAKVLILGSGMAGLVAAHELLKSGYDVELLEFNDRVGGRSWSIRGGDTYTELGGETQHCQFDKGLYLNPGPWRIPYHHHGYLHYARDPLISLIKMPIFIILRLLAVSLSVISILCRTLKGRQMSF